MSRQAVEEFLQNAANNGSLLAKLEAADSASRVVRIAMALGYEFTVSELTAVSEQMYFTSDSEELSDEDLDTVSGGWGVGNRKSKKW